MTITGNQIIDALLFTLLSMLVIYRASDAFETASEYIGRNLSDGVRGATINAIASSIPEVLTAFLFLVYFGDATGFAGGIGTTAGSAVFNSMIIPAAVVFFVIGLGAARSIQVSRKVILRDGVALLTCEFVLIVLISGRSLNWWHGLILMLLYLVYLFYMLSNMKRAVPESRQNDREKEVPEPATVQEAASTVFPLPALLKLDLTFLVLRGRPITSASAWVLLLVSTTVMAAACFILVFACEQMGYALGLPVYFVAVIIAAAATSVPDTIISIRDGLRGHYDDAVSNALGSNIFDICFALGFPLFVYTLIYGEIELQNDFRINELRLILFFLTAAALLVYLAGRNMTIVKAFILVAIYLLFVLFIIGESAGNPISGQVSELIHQITAYLGLGKE